MNSSYSSPTRLWSFFARFPFPFCAFCAICQFNWIEATRKSLLERDPSLAKLTCSAIDYHTFSAESDVASELLASVLELSHGTSSGEMEALTRSEPLVAMRTAGISMARATKLQEGQYLTAAAMVARRWSFSKWALRVQAWL